MTRERTSARGLRLAPLAGLLAGALLAGAALGQEVRVEEHLELEVRVTADEASTEAGLTRVRVVPLESAEAERWRARLSDADFDARERAFQELVVRGLKDRALFTLVVGWANDETTPDDLAWTARLALREMRHRVQPVRLTWVPRGAALPAGEAPLAAPEAATAEPIPGGERALAPTTPGESLRRIEMGWVSPQTPLKATQRVSLYAPRLVAPRAVQRNVQFHVQPEGVTVVVTELGPKGPRERRFAAGDIATLLDEHPELRHYVPGLGGLPLAGSGGAVPLDGAGAPRAIAVDARILGVKVTPIPLQVAEARLLGPGVGLLIERREPGTLAEHFDLRRGDILVEVAGQPVCSPEEISRALAERDSVSFQVKIVDRNGIERVHRWESAAAPEPSKAPGSSVDDAPPR